MERGALLPRRERCLVARDRAGTSGGLSTLTKRVCKREDQTVRVAVPLIAAFIIVAGANTSLAQPANPSPGAGAACPPDIKGDPPTVGGGSSEPLSDKLAQSKGVICPPAGVDREMQVTPPSGGHLKVIPAPGTPGGDPNVQPK